MGFMQSTVSVVGRAFLPAAGNVGIEDGEETEAVNPSLEKLWKESFKDFYREYAKPLWYYIYKTCGDANGADDILQESFYRFLRARPFDLNRCQQRAFLYKTAYRLVIDEKRKVKREQEKTPAPALPESPEKAVYAALDMENSFGELKPKERHLLWLAYVEGYSHREIADITGVKEKSVKVKLFRLRGKFADILRRRGYRPEEVT